MSFEQSDALLREQASVQDKLDLLSNASGKAVEARQHLNEMLGAISRYADVHYPMPYNRPDEPVLDLVRAANQAIGALIAALPDGDARKPGISVG